MTRKGDTVCSLLYSYRSKKCKPETNVQRGLVERKKTGKETKNKKTIEKPMTHWIIFFVTLKCTSMFTKNKPMHVFLRKQAPKNKREVTLCYHHNLKSSK